MKVNPGLAGWVGVAAVVAAADGYALRAKKPTLSDEFHDHYAIGLFLLAGTAAHLLAHRRNLFSRP